MSEPFEDKLLREIMKLRRYKRVSEKEVKRFKKYSAALEDEIKTLREALIKITNNRDKNLSPTTKSLKETLIKIGHEMDKDTISSFQMQRLIYEALKGGEE